MLLDDGVYYQFLPVLPIFPRKFHRENYIDVHIIRFNHFQVAAILFFHVFSYCNGVRQTNVTLNAMYMNRFKDAAIFWKHRKSQKMKYQFEVAAILFFQQIETCKKKQNGGKQIFFL
jgi:hypothetical protein